MSTAVAAPPAASPLAPIERQISPRQFTSITSPPPTAERAEPAQKRARSSSAEHAATAERSNSNGKASPNNSSRNGAVPPMIKVKKEPGSPAMASSRPRPKRLDLSSSMSGNHGPQSAAQPSAPLASRESAGLVIQDLGMACLSPGFQTNDPGMREQLQRSLDVRNQQRQIIESRNKGTGTKPDSAHESDRPQGSQDTTLFGVQTRTPSTARRRGPPPGLSIAAPAAAQFAHDRVIQSAPLHQTFTGLRPGDQPYTRHAQHGPSGLSQTSHIHHVPATQTSNRLPPIADVFANDRLEVQRGYTSNNSPSHVNGPPPVPSPGFPPQQQHANPMSARTREFRSAEEAMQGLSGGRDDLMPKVVHYGGVQPPTPPSPMPPGGHHHHHHHHQQHATAGVHQQQQQQQQQPGPHSGQYESSAHRDILSRTSSMNGRRRDREEFERDNGSPPSRFNHQSEPKRTAFAVRGDDRQEEDWRSGMSGAEKKEEFLRLCERAWDLFHS